MNNFLKFIISLGLICYSALVLMFLWSWFIADPWGLRELSYWQSVGVILAARILRGFKISLIKSELSDWEEIGFYFGVTSVAFVFGFIAHLLESGL